MAMRLVKINVENGRGQVLRSYRDETSYENSADRASDELFAYYIVATKHGYRQLTPNQWHGDEDLPQELIDIGDTVK